jgi:ATP-dependent protease HslVU (ClpYQ) peptidase subunit
MTCIVGYVEKERVYIGGDSAGLAGWSSLARADEKVFVKPNNGNPMIFGFTSSFRMGQIIRYSFKLPEQSSKSSDYEYLCSVFVDELRKSFKDKGYCEVKDNKERGGTFLMGYKGALYQINPDFQVGQSLKNYEAVGCGQDLALGALFALENNQASPDHKIKVALQAATEFSGAVRPPYNILSI